MIQHPLKSTNLATIGFNMETGTLVVQFNTGDFYRYSGVTADAFVGVLTNTDSHGRAFNELIKKPFGESAQKIDAADAALL